MVKKKLVLKRKVKIFLSKLMITTIIVLIALIYLRKEPTFKNKIIKNVYETNFKFGKAKDFYDKYFGKLIPLNKIVIEDKPVFNEKLSYSNLNTYKDGISLTVSNNYMVPALNSGVVTFIGEKKDYGKTVIIDQADGTEVFYSNIDNINLKLYDYIEKGDLLGETINNKLYLVFSKEGKYISYKDYL